MKVAGLIRIYRTLVEKISADPDEKIFIAIIFFRIAPARPPPCECRKSSIFAKNTTEKKIYHDLLLKGGRAGAECSAEQRP
jgi:hypothetical protein